MDTLSKFQSLLCELFQFEASDLDFGIYRILNYKRDEIDKFIKEDIKTIVENAFSKHKDERLLNITQKFEDARNKILETLGSAVFASSGDVKAEFKDTPVAKDYLLLKEQKDLAGKIDEIKLQVFNDLYTFFSRYYEEGDFVPQHRYSIKNFRYAIPYNGEEVKLHWANEGQYYTKTGILFRDYAFFSDAGKTYKIIFRTVSAREELSSNKATKARFFVLDDEKPVDVSLQGEAEAISKEAAIRFHYRELTDKEVKLYDVEGGSNSAKQEKINQKIFDEIIKQIKDATLKAFLSAEYRSEKSFLLYQISRFTAKNTKDYFIHKNLRKFLSEQLDYFIKAEVLSIETLENEPFLDKHITRAKVVREVGEKIIEFLSQVEDFQKKLWEKKKFVLKTEYVITTDRVPEEFYAEILKNKDQIKEWKEMGLIEGVIPAKVGIRNKKLPIDTNHFSEEFKEKLLEKLTEDSELDEQLDGLLIKSENWQALNLLTEKYRGKVKYIYIDPPYNTSDEAILYRNNYKHSSWIALLENRLLQARNMLSQTGVIAVAIDDTENPPLRLILDETFSPENRISTLAIEVNPAGQNIRPNVPALSHDYCHIYAKDIEKTRMLLRELTEDEIASYKEKDEMGQYLWDNLRRRGGNSRPADRPNQWFPLYVDVKSRKVSIDQFDGGEEVWPIDPKGEKRIWRMNLDGVKVSIEEGDISVMLKAGRIEIVKKSRMPEGKKPKTLWKEPVYSATSYGTKFLNNIIRNSGFTYPKSIYLVQDCLRHWAEPESLILDFFAGSGTTGHAVMNLNGEDDGRRKYCLIENANYFWTILMPRMKKIAFSFKWREGKPRNNNGIGTFFKYQILEQYEDALDNLEMKPNEAAQKLFKDEYLLKYFLEFETQDSPNLLNIEHLKDPFSYKLKINFEEMGEPAEAVADLPETFNYLLGLKVKRIKAREIATPSARKDKRRKYVFILGEKEGVSIAVVWRKVDDNWDEGDFKKDKEFIIKEIKAWMPQRVYINGQSILTTDFEGHPVEIHYIEPEFKTLMFS